MLACARAGAQQRHGRDAHALHGRPAPGARGAAAAHHGAAGARQPVPGALPQHQLRARQAAVQARHELRQAPPGQLRPLQVRPCVHAEHAAHGHAELLCVPLWGNQVLRRLAASGPCIEQLCVASCGYCRGALAMTLSGWNPWAGHCCGTLAAAATVSAAARLGRLLHACARRGCWACTLHPLQPTT